MSEKVCPECGAKISSHANECIECGYVLDQHNETQTRRPPALKPASQRGGGRPSTIRRKAKRSGKIVTFGSYKGESLQWIAVESLGNRQFLICRNVIDCLPYNEEQCATDWYDCTLRAWLNDEFLNEAFTEEERARILLTDVVNRDNLEYGIRGGADTEDYIFIPDIREADKYFDSDEDRSCKPTEYAQEQGINASDTQGTALWWLRSPGIIDYGAAFVFTNGAICHRGTAVDAFEYGVRPALWATL